MLRPFHPSWFDHPNNICWTVHIIKLLIMRDGDELQACIVWKASTMAFSWKSMKNYRIICYHSKIRSLPNIKLYCNYYCSLLCMTMCQLQKLYTVEWKTVVWLWRAGYTLYWKKNYCKFFSSYPSISDEWAQPFYTRGTLNIVEESWWHTNPILHIVEGGGEMVYGIDWPRQLLINRPQPRNVPFDVHNCTSQLLYVICFKCIHYLK
jgi:hypothetical protein